MDRDRNITALSRPTVQKEEEEMYSIQHYVVMKVELK